MSFTSGGAGRRGACTTKTAYPSSRAAWAGVDWMVETLGSYRPSMTIYRCANHKDGPKWHVSHRMTKDRKGKRR